MPYDPQQQWFTLEIKTERGGSLYLTFVVFSPGEYEIGSPSTEPARLNDEMQHNVPITRAFAVLDREITRGEFDASGVNVPVPPQVPALPKLPMVLVNWNEAVDFCRWLTQQAALSVQDQAYPDQKSDGPLRKGCADFRLPTEAEWEIACRGGASSIYAFGRDDTLLDRYAWFLDNSNDQPHPSRQKLPNLRGIFDMHGNALEWCHDWYAPYPAVSGDYPSGANRGMLHVVRGGSWDFGATRCRSAHRDKDARVRKVLGFRLAVSPSSWHAGRESN